MYNQLHTMGNCDDFTCALYRFITRSGQPGEKTFLTNQRGSNRAL